MKILFINPEFPDTFWSFRHALGFIRKKAGPPLMDEEYHHLLPEYDE